ncbi:hypothetical protein LMG27174_06507 [Paraburkholderia rhynchosiae]|uniref:Uncharacterized protein n=1 Tax=Paraburkholderia rhynchosiae TaxID=487049 RepID=A0A6J5CNP9_9BURK|nr:hypothetical protein [Paraburkholderia rhynchosiae]CAB3738948.1 hypothetical protein LMG27174_06507 [Paraburkholderia rhynchosiae]
MNHDILRAIILIMPVVTFIAVLRDGTDDSEGCAGRLLRIATTDFRRFRPAQIRLG